jgi:hypothetical protein
MEDVGICYCHLVYFAAIWNIFPILVYCTQEKSGNPDENFGERDGFI